MKLYLFLGITFLINLSINSQININEDLMDDIEKNILIYRINNIKLNNICTFGKPINFDKLLPDKNQTLSYNMILDTLITYNREVILFKITTNYSFVEKEIFNNGSYTYREVKFYTSDDVNIYNLFLVGYNIIKKEIIYISGDFFKNCIADNFNLNINNPNSFNQFLKLKLYNYSIGEVSFEKKKKKYFLFKAYSKQLEEDLYIRVHPKDYDMLQVKTVKSSWTETGSYKWEKNKWRD